MYHFLDQQGNIDTQREEAYRTAIESPGRPPDYVYGTVYFEDEELEPLDIDNTNMPQNAVSISKQCVDDNALMFGGVFTSVLNLSIMTDLDRYVFYNAKIVLKYDITVGYTEPEQEGEEPEPIYETVPLGIFYVAEADRPGNTVKLIAYDSITLLDVQLGGEVLSGSAWEMFQKVERTTGYELGFDEAFVSNLPNSSSVISASAQDGMNTYRDVVKEICQLLGCFAMDNREGKLLLKTFSTTPDLTLDTSSWYSMTPADYKCNYIGVSITSRSGTYEKMSENPNARGLIYTVSDAPAWDYGIEEEQERRTEAIYDVITAITYTPASIDMPGDVTFDCGDMFELIPRNADPEDPTTHIKTIATSIEWKFHQGMTIESVGINPYIEGSSAASSTTDRLVEQAVEKSKIQFLNFSNLGEIDVSSGSTNRSVLLGECRFTPTNLTDSLFIGTVLLTASEIPVNVEGETTEYQENVNVTILPYDEQEQQTTVTDINGNPVTFSGTVTNTHKHTYYRDNTGLITIYYKLEDIIVPSDEHPYLAKETVTNGNSIITLSYPFTQLNRGHTYHLEVWMVVSEGFAVHINLEEAKFTLFGQEVDNVNEFSGFIDVNEEPIGLISFSTIIPLAIYEDEQGIDVTFIESVPINATDAVSLYNIASIGVKQITEGTGVLAPQIFMQGGYNLGTETDDYFASEDDFRFITE